MSNVQVFYVNLLNEFKRVESLLIELLKKEKIMEDDILVKRGFIIKKYILNYSKINLSQLDKLLFELERIIGIEVHLYEQLDQHSDLIGQLEKEYLEITKSRLHSDLLLKELKEVLHYSKLMTTRIKQLRTMLEEGVELHKKQLGKDIEIFFASFEHIANKILKFIHFLEQLTNKILNFEQEAYYPESRAYGRAMSFQEFKKTFNLKRLSSGKDPTPVFDASTSVVRQIKSMTKDQLKNFFAQVGVEGAAKVIFFKTKVKPFNHDRPIPQSNGLREYKFPQGMSIEILEAA